MWKTTAILCLGAILAACQYAGPAGNPIARNLTWFSYVGGEDLRNACRPGVPDHMRFVYNGIYEKEIRSYDVRVLPGNRGAAVTAFARGVADLTKAVPIDNLLGPWRGTRAEAVMDPTSLAGLRRSLADARFAAYKPAGLRLPSNEYYWIVTACLDGRFETNAWLYPSDRFEALRFPAILRDHDRTEVAFGRAVPAGQRDQDPTLDGGDKGPKPFELQLGSNRIIGGAAAF